jgi:hypothetical protein
MAEKYLEIPPMCLHYEAPGDDGMVGCRKGHVHHEDEYYCLKGECPDYEPDLSENMNLIGADILDLLSREDRPITHDEMVGKLQDLTRARRGQN